MRLLQVAALLFCAWPAARVLGASDGEPARWFADRPVAWDEHDDEHVSTAPRASHLQVWDKTLHLRDSLANEIERVLALEGARPAEDVNALDEVPCSTWFCARHHLRPLTPSEIGAGPPARAPRLPLRIVKGKDQGASPGFQVVDAEGRKFLLKLDPLGRLGLSTGAEVVGQLVFHAAGYNVPGAFIVDLEPDRDLELDPGATFRLFGVEERPLGADRVRAILAEAARTADGRVRAVAVPWIAGDILGAFDMIGRRPDDPNDRIPHEHRRSLRASWVLFAWLGTYDATAINTLDTYVGTDGQRFVRHYFIDFGAGLGGMTTTAKGPHQGREHLIEVGRTLAAFASLGLYRRPFQDERAAWERLTAQYPSVGWFPAEGFAPDDFRTNRKVPAHALRTARDTYWGAKVVTAFSDEELAALVAKAGLAERDAAYVAHALRVRRDIIGRRYLRAMTAVERPIVAADGVCFQDLAVARGYVEPPEIRYSVEVSDGAAGRLLAAEHGPPDGPGTCVPLPTGPPGTGYRIVQVTARLAGSAHGPPLAAARATRIHLRFRPAEQRFVVVGLERDE